MMLEKLKLKIILRFDIYNAFKVWTTLNNFISCKQEDIKFAEIRDILIVKDPSQYINGWNINKQHQDNEAKIILAVMSRKY